MKRIGHRQSESTTSLRREGRGPFLAIGLLLTLSFLLGGSARGDVASLMLLRPTSILLLGYGLWGLKHRELKSYRQLFGLAVAMVGLTLIQLVPLPPAIWSQLPGRELVVEIDRTAGLGPVWRPISLAPDATWNALYAMTVPLGVLVLGARLTIEESSKLVLWLIALGLLSSLLGLLQIIGPVDGPLYFYRFTSTGAAVGLFANRNHEAIFLASMFPLLAAFVTLSHSPGRPTSRRAAIALGICALLIPLIFITGSRAGLICASIGLGLCALLYRPSMRDAVAAKRSDVSDAKRGLAMRVRVANWLSSPWFLGVFAGLELLALSVTTISLGRAEALQRILTASGSEEFRFQIWPSIASMASKYFPFGSGVGSFVQVYQVDEARVMLNAAYLNHAHNDYLELLLTGGLPALLILIYAFGLVFVRSAQLVRCRNDLADDVLLARLGLVLVVLFGLASIGDYPLRTPALSSLFALAALWAARPLGRTTMYG